MRSDLTAYFKEVEKHLTCPRKERKAFLDNARRMVADLELCEPDLGYDGVVDFLGDPRSLAQTFLNGVDPAIVENHQKKANRLKQISISLLSLSLVFFIGLSAYTIWYKENTIYEMQQILIVYPEGIVPAGMFDDPITKLLNTNELNIKDFELPGETKP